ncbi:hypothetical protein ACTFIZ_003559 [Dictyostelium cf. discoideum]
MFSIVINLVFPNKFSKTRKIEYSHSQNFFCDISKKIYQEFNVSESSELILFKSEPESIISEIQYLNNNNLEYVRGDCILPKLNYDTPIYFAILEEMYQEIKNKNIEKKEIKSLDQLEIKIKKDISENLDKEYHDDEDFLFLERGKSIGIIIENIKKMFDSFKNKSTSRSDHIFLTCLAGEGMGKTRLGIECYKYFTSPDIHYSFNFIVRDCINIKIDFYGGDKINDDDIKYSPEIGLCKRLFSRSILGCSLETSGLIDKLSSNENKLFTLKETFKFIVSKHRINHSNHITIFLHLDEFQIAHEECTKKYNKPEFIKEMIELLGFFRCNRNKSFANETNIFIIPFLTGTNTGPIDNELLKWDFENISLNTLSLQSAKFIICSKLNCEIKQLQHDLLNIFIMDLGVVPRYIQKLIKYIKLYKNNKTINYTLPKKLIEFAGSKLKNKIRTKKFDYKLDTLECLLYYIVCGVEVSWETVIGGKTIKELTYSGHIYPFQNSNSGFFNIFIPTIDLNIMATRLSMSYLSTITQYPHFNEFIGFQFNYITSIIIILKNDLLKKYKSTIVNLRDIFGDIIDGNEIMIKLKQLYLVKDSSNWFNGLDINFKKLKDKIEVYDDNSSRKINILIEQPGYISLLCNGCTIFDIRLNFELQSSNDNSKTNLMVVISTKYTNCGKEITEKVVSNIYTTYQKLCKKYTKSIIIPIIISNCQLMDGGFPSYKQVLIYHKDNIDGSFFGNLIHRVKTTKD